MKLSKNEFTYDTFVNFLNEKFTNKTSGEKFNKSDVAQYLLRGRLPKKYGFNKLIKKEEAGVVLIVLDQNTKVNA